MEAICRIFTEIVYRAHGLAVRQNTFRESES